MDLHGHIAKILDQHKNGIVTTRDATVKVIELVLEELSDRKDHDLFT